MKLRDQRFGIGKAKIEIELNAISGRRNSHGIHLVMSFVHFEKCTNANSRDCVTRGRLSVGRNLLELKECERAGGQLKAHGISSLQFTGSGATGAVPLLIS